MAVRSGFWNSVGTNRRTYYNHDFSHLISLLIKDGIHQNYGNNFIVKPGSGMEVIVQTGEAWFNETWVLNDSDLAITIDPSPIVSGFKRIDAIAIKIDASQSVMEGTIEYLKGSETAGTPVMPTMEDSDDIHWYLLATIEIATNDSSISASKITNYVGTSRTPFISGILSTISADILMSKWQAEFNEWFDHMKGQLSEDAAGHLQLEIDDINDDVADIYSAKQNKTDNTLTTVAKTIVGAINELLGKFTNYFTKSETDERYVNTTGDTMSGTLHLTGTGRQSPDIQWESDGFTVTAGNRSFSGGGRTKWQLLGSNSTTPVMEIRGDVQGLPYARLNGSAREADNAINADKWGGLINDISTNNTTDTWVPVIATNNTMQHRIIPTTILDNAGSWDGLAKASSMTVGYDTAISCWIFDMNFPDGTLARLAINTNGIGFSTLAQGTWTQHWYK